MMQRVRIKKIGIAILAGILSVMVLSCTTNNKSKLVMNLEEIFYNENFTRVSDKIFNVADYGAIADGKTLATKAIQDAIDAASKAGGGKVVFDKGVYLTGAIFIKSNIEFNVGEGVVIQAIQDDSQYPERMTRIAGFEMEWPSALINVYEESNVRITGKGTIDGNGKYWWDKFWGDPPRSGGMWVDYKEKDVRWAVDYDCKRVRAVVIYKSENVLLRDFTVKRSGFWTISLTYSNKVHVDGITIRNNIDGFGPSSDGINTDSSKDILVENCDIDCNDDNLCIKAGRDADGLRVNRPSENIVYRNCITRAGHGLITLGSETSGGMKNIEVYGLEAIGTNIGVRIKSAKVRGGVMQNIWFHDIKMKDVANPFHFELNWYPEYSYPTIPDNIPENEIPDRWRLLTKRVTPPELGIPEFKDITLSDINVVNAKRAIYANAYEEKPMNNLNWKNISIEAEEGGSVNHASNWNMKNVTLKLKTSNSIELNNCEGVEEPQVTYIGKTESDKSTVLLSVEEQIENIKNDDNSVVIIPVNINDASAVTKGDTTSASDLMHIKILQRKNASIKYYEPLGDGFYFSEVDISVKKDGNIIEVTGQKEHEFTFEIISDTKPNEVLGADNWEYNAEEQVLRVSKKGKNIKLEIQ